MPWVPATARHRRVAAMAASISARRSTGMPRRPGRRQLGVVGGHRRRAGRPRRPRRRARRRWPTQTSTPSAARRSVTGEAMRSLPVTWWPMAASTRGDGAHAGPADPDDVDARGCRVRSRAGSARAGWPRPPRPPGPRRRAGPAPRRPRPSRRDAVGSSTQAAVDQLVEVRRRRTRRRTPARAAPASTRPGRWRSGGRPARRAAGRGPPGSPTAASSATVMAPARQTHHVGGRVEVGHPVLVGDQPVAEPVAGGRAARRADQRARPSPAGRSRGRCEVTAGRPSAGQLDGAPG